MAVRSEVRKGDTMENTSSDSGSSSGSDSGSGSSSDKETDQKERVLLVGDSKLKAVIEEEAVIEEFTVSYGYHEVGESSTMSVQKDHNKITPKLVIKRSKPQKEEDMPRKLKDHIEHELRGRNLFRVCQKTLTATDVNPKQMRLSLPKSDISSLSFLDEEEMATLHDDRKNGHRVLLIDPDHRLRMPSFRRWKSKEDKSGNRSPIYVLTTAVWADIARINDLIEGDEIQIWSFRILGQLCMALVIVKRAPRSHEQLDNEE